MSEIVHAEIKVIGDNSSIFSEFDLEVSDHPSLAEIDNIFLGTPTFNMYDGMGYSHILQTQYEVKKKGHRFSLEISSISLEPGTSSTFYGFGFQFTTQKSHSERRNIGGLLE